MKNDFFLIRKKVSISKHEQKISGLEIIKVAQTLPLRIKEVCIKTG